MKTAQELIDFESWVVETFNAGKLRSPVHLSGGNEEQLIKIFERINPQDWVFTTYRSHYHALLKGVPEERLKNWILDNKSIHFMDAEHKVFSSAIVGGTLPIALGVALAIKKKEEQTERDVKEVIDKIDIEGTVVTLESVKPLNPVHVYCFVGDMTSETGGFFEAWKYANYHGLPITFIVEDNGLSTDTKTKEVWNKKNEWEWANSSDFEEDAKVIHYTYERKYPHYGTGKFIDAIWKEVKESPVGKGF